ncbi:ubiquitin carboxyl-terminal hydrolase 24 isoform X2 [Agrilus planipennis]|uniref:Ubiquitin carboxyl-terminal hydrolase n=1 Tax=Agrilus planipennis TaxID=224129 RepID=A0A1W4W3C7_AGRPL|nr:ubiquitin carboxyl-terminal hydrolase 24 isoform X2 [Agrilus planipennis]
MVYLKRQGSITEDGVTTRFKEELCEPNSLRDSLSWGDSVRESSVYDGLPSRYDRESSLTRSISRDTTTTSSSRAPLTPINVAESVAELHKKYSPANYVPACRRKSEIISRSKSINDIGKPPLLVEQSIENKKVINNGVNYNNGLSVYNNTNNSSDKTYDNDYPEEDDNGNRASVAEICKKFDQRIVPSNGEDEKRPYENGYKKFEPVETKLRRIEPVETRLKKTEPVETRLKKTEPVEARLKKVEPLETRLKKAEPVEGRFKKTEPLENGFKKFEATENGLKKGEPIENGLGKSELKLEKPEPDEGDTVSSVVKISENRFKKLDNEENKTKIKKPEQKTTRESIKKTDPDAPKTKTLKLKSEKSSTPKSENGLMVNGTGIATTKPPIKKAAASSKKKLNQENTDASVKIDSTRCMPENGSKSKLGEVSDVVNDDGVELRGGKSILDVTPDLETQTTAVATASSSTKVSVDKAENEGEDEDEVEGDGKNRRTSNFASYIPSEEFVRGDVGKDSSVNEDEDDTSNDMDERHILSDNSRYILHNENTSSLERHHRAGAGGREHLDSYGRQSAAPLPHLGGVGSVVSTRNTGLNGLKNIGNTCFMNSVLQCLSNTRPLLEYVKNDSYLKDINTTISGMKGALIKAFAQVIKELWSEDSSDRVVNTVSLKSQIQRFAPRFMGYAQQDAQEFLRYLLEGLHEDVNCVTVKPKPIHTEIDEKLSDSEKSAESWRRYLRMDNSKIVDIFVGQLKSTLRCTHCGHCSVTFDPFWDLSLPIPQRAGPLRLQQCLECFTREETLDGDEKPTCSKCKERRKCTKSFSIQKFPKILVIHLKRFSPTERYRGKLSLTIDFPIEGLDMQNYAADGSNGDCRYNLYAISNHSGTTYSGHYTAYCRHPYTQSWHEYNDSRVSPISSKSLVSGEAYVLFYELENQKSHL